MGCDIHSAIEYRENGQWKAFLVRNENFGKKYYEDESEYTARLDFGRNYDVFAILGNVRNGRGFAGCDTGDEFDPMSDNRGLPGDISPEALEAMSDEHSATWVSLTEMLAYDWTRTITKRGWVDATNFAQWDRMKQWHPWPKEWSGGIAGNSIVHISADQMKANLDSFMEGKEYRKAIVAFAKMYAHTYCQIKWQVIYADAGKLIWTGILPHMLRLGAIHGIDNVRLVMEFDS